MASELSMDARVLLTAWFLNGSKTTVEVGGAKAKSRMTGRAVSAVNELVAAGHVTAQQITADGRMRYQGTAKRDGRLSLALMEEHGAWSPTEPNPDASETNKTKSTATIRLRSEPQP